MIQEVFEGTPDCVMDRPNSQFVRDGNIDWQRIVSRRYVNPAPDRANEIELGPSEDAYGLGDTLMVIPSAKALPNAVMCLPPFLKKYAFLFNGACRVRITDDFPVFPYIGGKLASQSKLEFFGLHSDTVPSVQPTSDAIDKAKVFLSRFKHPLAFVPCCAKEWSHVREAPVQFWKEVISAVKDRFDVLQFGRSDYEVIEGTARMPWLSLEDVAAIYSVIGRYMGVNTGDYHLMIAVGGMAVVAEAKSQHGFDARVWQYPNLQRVSYCPFTDAGQMTDAVLKKLSYDT